MKVSDLRIQSSWFLVQGWFHVRMPVPGGQAMWDVPEVVYWLVFHDNFHSYGDHLVRLNGTIPLDVSTTDEQKMVQAIELCLRLVVWALDEHGRTVGCNRRMEFPPQNVFDVAFSALVTAALKGVRDIGAHSYLATMLVPLNARMATMPMWLETRTPESLKSHIRKNNCYNGPFWDEVVDELSGAKKSDRKE